MENIDILKEVEIELIRFTKKLKEAIKQEENKPKYQFTTRGYAAAKRSALDLKFELTKLTQDSKYKYK
jgi:hypothetical protein